MNTLCEHEPITEFFGDYRWLSNFYECHVHYDGVYYSSSENAYQAAKTTDFDERFKISEMSPGQSKMAGRSLTIRDDWYLIKVDIMREIIMLKFAQNAELRRKLVDTGDALLVEGNTWNDKFWGQCPVGVGQNMLGKLLMETRNKFQ